MLNIIIGNVDSSMQEFIKKEKFASRTLVINKMCNVKYITEPVVIYVPFGVINKYGLVENTMVHFEELLISLNVVKVFYGNKKNIELMNKFETLFNVKTQILNCK